MSTRGAIGFVLNNKWYVAYNHVDSYPSELGMDVLNFCKWVADWEILAKKVKRLHLVNSTSRPSRYCIKKYMKFCGSRLQCGGWRGDWYSLLRGIQGADTLYSIYCGELTHMFDDYTFLGDSLFCQWAYIIDLDNMTLNVYKGNNQHNPEKCINLPADIKIEKDGDYYPVAFLYAYSLTNLPEFMLGVTNEFKKFYREKMREQTAEDKKFLEMSIEL